MNAQGPYLSLNVDIVTFLVPLRDGIFRIKSLFCGS